MLKDALLATLLFLTVSQATDKSLTPMRMTPAEIRATDAEENQTGGSGVPGGHRRVLYGDPEKAGFYSILLFVPPHATIQAHSHRDDRMATVVSGTWHFGYGTHFDENALKTLPVGSVYSEPGGVNHFARTAEDPVVVQISGFGPTDTRYFNSADDPESRKKSE